MKYKIDSMIEDALSYDELSPNEAILKVAKEHPEDVNTEVLKRLTEGYNTKKFVMRKNAGLAIDASFPIADAKKVIAAATKDVILKFVGKKKKDEDKNINVEKKTPEYKGEIIEDHELEPEDIFKAAYYKDDAPLEFSVESKWSPNPYKWTAQRVKDDGITKEAHLQVKNRQRNETLEYAFTKVADYLNKFKDSYSCNAQFVRELRYLCPNSMILKRAGLDSVGKSIPKVVGTHHEEFLDIERILEKLGAKKKKKKKGPKNQPQPKQPQPQQNQHQQQWAKQQKRIQEALEKEHVKDVIEQQRKTKKELEEQKKLKDKEEQEKQKLDEIEPALEEAKQLIPGEKREEIRKALFSKLRGEDYKRGKTEHEKFYEETIGSLTDEQKSLWNSARRKKKLGKPLDADEKDIYNKLGEPPPETTTAEKAERIAKTVGHLGVGGYKKVVKPLAKSVYEGMSKLKSTAPYKYIEKERDAAEAALRTYSPTVAVIDAILDTKGRAEAVYEENTRKWLQIVRQKAIFEDLLTEEPRLQGADPNQLLNVYEAAVSVAPTAMQNKELARQILTSTSVHGQGGLDPQLMKILLELEDKIRKLRAGNLGGNPFR